jgi:hypothetical protein
VSTKSAPAKRGGEHEEKKAVEKRETILGDFSSSYFRHGKGNSKLRSYVMKNSNTTRTKEMVVSLF